MLRWPVWLGVVCEDLQAQRRFYREVLGLVELQSGEHWVWFELDGNLLELLAKRPLPQYDRRRVSFAFDVDDIQSARAVLLERGVEPVTGIEGGPEFRQYWAYFKDTEGNLFELVQRLEPTQVAPERAFVLKGIDHVALTVRDVAQSVRWYEDVLGLKRLYEYAWGDFPAVVGVGTTALALFPLPASTPQSSPGQAVPAIRHIAFATDAENFVRAQRDLAQKQIPFEVQDHGIAHSIYLHDPNGHEIEITTYNLNSATAADVDASRRG